MSGELYLKNVKQNYKKWLKKIGYNRQMTKEKAFFYEKNMRILEK